MRYYDYRTLEDYENNLNITRDKTQYVNYENNLNITLEDYDHRT